MSKKFDEIMENIEMLKKDNIVTTDFSNALTCLKNGIRMKRLGWNGKGMFIYLVPGSTFTVNRAPLLGFYPEGTPIKYLPHIDMRTSNGDFVPWLASQTDLLASDWVEYEG